MTKIEAIQRSIDKWTSIRDSEIILIKGLESCALCDYSGIARRMDRYSIQRVCDYCPLNLVGQRCGFESSIWKTYRFFIIENGISGRFLKNICDNIKNVASIIINDMLNALNECLEMALKEKENEKEGK